jgi:hypothetical protein
MAQLAPMLTSPPNSPTGLRRYTGPDIQRRHCPRPLSPFSRPNRPSRLTQLWPAHAQIPIVSAQAPPNTSPFRRFVPWRFSDAGRCPCGIVRDGRRLKTFTEAALSDYVGRRPVYPRLLTIPVASLNSAALGQEKTFARARQATSSIFSRPSNRDTLGQSR